MTVVEEATRSVVITTVGVEGDADDDDDMTVSTKSLGKNNLDLGQRQS